MTRQPMRGVGFLKHGNFEYRTLAVGFGTCDQAQTSAREISMLLCDGWHVDRMLSTPASDFGCVVFVRETQAGSETNPFTDSMDFKGEQIG